jgi:outer membrane protein assembly factor BamA
MRINFFSIIFFISGLLTIKANGDSTRVKRIRLIALPVIFHLPETQWGAGVAGIIRFRQKSEPDSMRYSNVTFAFSDTQLNQIVFSTPFQFWLNHEKYNVYGEFGFQSENYLFFGIGNHIPSNFQERYHLHVPRLRVSVLQRIYAHLYAGLIYSIENTTLINLLDTGMLIKGTIPGSKGGLVSGAGGTLKYDNRDNQFYATKGYYVELFVLANSKITGSDYNFNKYSLNVSTYKALPLRQVLAFNAYALVNQNDVPFYQMAMLGGDTRMRGMYNGRYRDKNCWILQAEYRVELFWKLGAAVFGGIGDVAPRINQFDLKNTRSTYGGGIRLLIDKKQHLNLRFDAGISNKTLNYYFTIAEAF